MHADNNDIIMGGGASLVLLERQIILMILKNTSNMIGVFLKNSRESRTTICFFNLFSSVADLLLFFFNMCRRPVTFGRAVGQATSNPGRSIPLL